MRTAYNHNGTEKLIDDLTHTHTDKRGGGGGGAGVTHIIGDNNGPLLLKVFYFLFTDNTQTDQYGGVEEVITKAHTEKYTTTPFKF